MVGPVEMKTAPKSDRSKREGLTPEQYVMNTIEAGREASKCKTDEQKANFVRTYLERGGGPRTGLRPQSAKRYGTTLYLPEGITFSDKIVDLAGPASYKEGTSSSKLPAGLYWFAFDSEKNDIALHNLDDPHAVVRLSLSSHKGESASSFQTNANKDTVELFFNAIKNTSSLYASNQSTATTMEKALDEFYGTGWKKDQELRGGISTTSMQGAGVSAFKSAISGIVRRATENKIEDIVDLGQDMALTWSQKIKPGLVGYHDRIRDTIREALKLTSTSPTDLYVGFGVIKHGEKDEIVVNAYKHVVFGQEDWRNFTLMYQISDGGRGSATALDNDFEKQNRRDWRKKVVPLNRTGYSNRKVKGEEQMELELKRAELQAGLDSLTTARGVENANLKLSVFQKSQDPVLALKVKTDIETLLGKPNAP